MHFLWQRKVNPKEMGVANNNLNQLQKNVSMEHVQLSTNPKWENQIPSSYDRVTYRPQAQREWVLCRCLTS